MYILTAIDETDLEDLTRSDKGGDVETCGIRESVRTKDEVETECLE